MSFGDIEKALQEKGYQLHERIGLGAYSECFKVYSSKYKQLFACKVMNINNNYTANQLQLFNNEFTALGTVLHSNIVHIYDTFVTDSHLYMILEYCQNGDLANYVKVSGPIKGQILLVYTRQILEALAFLESKHISHNDIKPSNIFIDSTMRVKLGDFGLSQKIHPKDYLLKIT